MITDKTILIIGAGSNKVYGFPTGTELRRYIIKEFEKDLNSIWDEIDPPQNPEKGQFLIFSSHPQINSRKKQGYLKIAQKFIERFNASSNLSIDLFIARNPDFAEVGKLSIIMKLLKAEFKSKFREDLDRANQNQDWYIHIFKKLSEGLTHSESYINFKKNDISFITFNYDRSIEYFIHESFYNSFNSILPHRNELDQNSDLSSLKLMPFSFHHVYGKIADLPWQSEEHLEFAPCGEIEIKKYIGNIKIIYDERKIDKEIELIRQEIQSAKNIFFLGFGYAIENLQILGIPNILRAGQNIYGTALNYKEKEIGDLKKIFLTNRKFSDAIGIKKSVLILKDSGCLDLLREYM